MKILRGQSIVEVVIATALISMAVIAAMSLTTNSLKQNTYAKSLAEATKYASQAADWLRSQRQSIGWASMATKEDGTYCLNDFPTRYSELVLGPCNSDDFIGNTLYQRQINVEQTSNTIKITVVVSWQEKTTRQATIELELAQW